MSAIQLEASTEPVAGARLQYIGEAYVKLTYQLQYGQY